MNILILSHIYEDLEFWKTHTLELVNNLSSSYKYTVTLFVVRLGQKDYDLRSLVSERVDYKEVVLKLAKDEDILEVFFDQNKSKPIYDVLHKVWVSSRFDYVHLESILFLNLISKFRTLDRKRVVYRQYFVESQYYARDDKVGKFSFFRIFTGNKYLNKLVNLETSLHSNVGYLITSVPDFLLNYKGEKFYVVPSEVPEQEEYKFVPELKLFYVGDLRLTVIQRAVLWFLNEMWPHLIERFPDLEFYLAGPTETWFKEVVMLQKKVIYAEVEDDLNHFLDQMAILILPHDQALGMFDQYMLALRKGKILIANSGAIRGWGINNIMLHYLPIRKTQRFVEVMENLVTKEDVRKFFSEQMYKFARDNFNFKYLAKLIMNFYQHIDD